MTPRLTVTGIRKSFGATQALAGVDLTLMPGTVLALIGENGAGKSTLMQVLTGAYRPDAGTMQLDGGAYAPADPQAARLAGLAIVRQELSLCAHLSVADNIALGAWPAHAGVVDRRQVVATARAALARIGSDIDPDARCGDLPPAARQLCEIARALAGTPRVLVLDEPTSSLGHHDAAQLLSAVQRLAADGVAVIWISHALEECRAVAQYYAVLRDGAVVGSGSLTTITDAELIACMVGRSVTDMYPQVPRTRGAAHSDIIPGITVHRGEIFGIYGLIGSGRSRLLRGMYAPPAQRIRAGVGFVSEDRKLEGLLLSRSLADNLTASRWAPCVIGGWLSRSRQHQFARDLIAKLGVRCRDPQQNVGELSGGNQQKIAIGRLLHQHADLMLLDEPTRGVDVGAKAQIYHLISEQAAAGAAIVMVSSYLPELLGMCDTLAVMRAGKLGPARPIAEWSRESALAAAL